MDIENLLNRICDINKKYEQFAKLSGENFNVFSVLGLSSSENHYSLFIAELLNPKGSHGQGDLYLRLFINQLGLDSDFTNVEVITEHDTGEVSTDYSEGGRIDIYIKSTPQNIIIENKIYAGDQLNQLYRYHVYDTNAKLLYLTLDGKVPSEESLGNLNIEQIRLVSYQTDIVNWLDDCIEKSSTLPIVRETIVQYRNIVNKLTNQCSNKDKEMEIANILLSSEDSFNAAILINEEINKIQKIVDDVWLKISKSLEYRFGKNNLNNVLRVDEEYSLQINFCYEFGLKFGIAPLKNNKMEWNGGFRYQDNISLNKLNKKIQEYVVDNAFNIGGYSCNIKNYFCLIPLQDINVNQHTSYLYDKRVLKFSDYTDLLDPVGQQKIIDSALLLCEKLKLFIETIDISKL